ncbi:J domain-containing protein [uncultured Marinobacter sp.]|uniref:J domain-containing protein n=1 Tax=uncultured Marinobacter sp. TaxID=187379 RepID=UPI0030DB07F8
MNCWEILGIEPTRNETEIRAAYERQKKFASNDDLRRLDSALSEALGRPVAAGQRESIDQPSGSAGPGLRSDRPESGHQLQAEDTGLRALDAGEQQLVREVVIQVRAMLNDSYRMNDVAVWRAILAEPPADRRSIRLAIGEALEQEVRPMAENGSFTPPVARFLGDWFEWYGLAEAHQQAMEQVGDSDYAGQGDDATGQNEPDAPQMVNFWPAVIGWVVGVVVLYSLFSALTGN